MEELDLIVESIIFVSEEPVSIRNLREVLSKVATTEEEEKENEEKPTYSDEAIQQAIQQIQEKYASETYSFELRKIAGGYQFLTKEAFFPYIKQSRLEHNQKKLSRAALETLSIIAYRQPVTKSEIEFIRGVNSDYATQKLLEKKLVAIVGRSDGPGKPLLYGTSTYFMQYFGIGEIQDLPKLKEFEELEETHLEKFKQFQEEKNKKPETETIEKTHDKSETDTEEK